MKTRVITITTIVNSQPAWISSYSTQKTDTSNQDFGWKVVGHTYDEQVRLRDMATMTAAWPKAVDNTVPTVPCLSADGHLLVLSASASRVRKYPNLVDVIQWNFSSLALTDVMPIRYFQMQALHDCLIRYGDQSEWLGMLDLDEYIVPLDPYQTVLDY
ncbi:unnamed protein product, partial [Rotaria sordida]